MDQENAFREWLPKNNVAGASIKAYISYITSVEKARGKSVDELLSEGIDHAVKEINHELIYGRGDETLRSYKQGVRKYWKFLQSQKNGNPAGDITFKRPRHWSND